MTTDAEIVNKLVDRVALAGTAWAEGRGDWRQGHSSVEERIAVMTVARNRLKTPGKFQAKEASYRGIVLAPWQFSCWNKGSDSNHQALMALMERVVLGLSSADALFEETLFLADGVISHVILDQTGGATFYYAPKAMKPIDRVPAEARRFAAAGGVFTDIGEQRFYT